MMKRINVYVREGDYEWLRKVATANDMPIAELIRYAIENYRLREDHPLGEAYVPIDFGNPDLRPSDKEKTLKGVQERLERLEKFVFDKVITTRDLPNAAHYIQQGFLPDYMKK
jgi:hypothetical protein